MQNSRNDGTLNRHIPTFEIMYDVGQSIRKTLKKQEVYVKADMNTRQDNNLVEVDFWYTSVLDLGLKLTNEMAALAKSFGQDHSKPLFTPRIATYSCTQCPKEFKEKNCVSDGRYCAFEPRYMEAFNLENDEEFKLTGRQVIMEALREKCFSKIISGKYHD